MKKKQSVSFWAGAIMAASIAAICIISFFWMPADPEKMDTLNRFALPSAAHLLGTDQFGRDVLSRIMEASRWALLVGVCSVTVGALAGFFAVPMNALLQHRGQQLLGAGESIAVQNFNENLSVLAMLGAYAALQMTGWPLHRTVFALGSVVALGVSSVMWRYRLVGARRQLLEGEQT
mgnify:CR=1 FL=1